jgi:hypothetical protein
MLISVLNLVVQYYNVQGIKVAVPVMMKAAFIRIGESRKMIHVSVTSGEWGSVL